jgi:hypothetical protein
MKHAQHLQTPDASPNAGMTTAPIVAQPTQTATVRPEWIRLPKPGSLCPWTGLSRTKLWELIANGHVRSVCLRKSGAKKGARLVHLASLLSHLESLASEQVPASPAVE